MTVLELKRMIASWPDNALIVTHGDDHSYFEISGWPVKAVYNSTAGHLSEYWDSVQLEKDEVVLDVILFD